MWSTILASAFSGHRTTHHHVALCVVLATISGSTAAAQDVAAGWRHCTSPYEIHFQREFAPDDRRDNPVGTSAHVELVCDHIHLGHCREIVHYTVAPDVSEFTIATLEAPEFVRSSAFRCESVAIGTELGPVGHVYATWRFATRCSLAQVDGERIVSIALPYSRLVPEVERDRRATASVALEAGIGVLRAHPFSSQFSRRSTETLCVGVDISDEGRAHDSIACSFEARLRDHRVVVDGARAALSTDDEVGGAHTQVISRNRCDSNEVSLPSHARTTIGGAGFELGVRSDGRALLSVTGELGSTRRRFMSVVGGLEIPSRESPSIWLGGGLSMLPVRSLETMPVSFVHAIVGSGFADVPVFFRGRLGLAWTFIGFSVNVDWNPRDQGILWSGRLHVSL